VQTQPSSTPAGAVPARPAQDLGLIVDPRSLGLAAFATTTFAFGLSYTTIWDNGVASVLALALAYGGAIQVLAGIWAFARRLMFPAVTFCSFGAFYVGYYLFVHSIESGLRPADATTALAVFLLAWLIFSFYVFIAALRVSGTVAVVHFFWFLTYLLLVIGLFLGNTNVVIGGGAAGVATAAAAWYGSCALLVNHTFGKEVLPLFASHTG
jgi:succinate-acetate transporter protein